jgi:hypothetical protein
MVVTDRRRFLRSRPCPDAAPTAVIANAVNVIVIDDCLVVDVGHMHVRDVIHRPVIKEVVVIPIPALVTGTAVSEAVIHAAVEADVLPPIALVK